MVEIVVAIGIMTEVGEPALFDNGNRSTLAADKTIGVEFTIPASADRSR